jgi:hypothetical protein
MGNDPRHGRSCAMTRRPGAAVRAAAFYGLGVFVAAVLIEHALTPSLSPARHTISEYANAGTGAIMTVGFAAWAVSLAATGAWAWLDRHGRLLALLLALAALGMALTACFPTQTVAGSLPPGMTRTATGRLHDLGSGLTSLTLLMGAIVSASQLWPPRRFRISSAIVVAAAVLIDATLLAVGPDVAGIRQRLLVVIGGGWQLLLLKALAAGDAQRRQRPCDEDRSAVSL